MLKFEDKFFIIKFLRPLFKVCKASGKPIVESNLQYILLEMELNPINVSLSLKLPLTLSITSFSTVIIAPLQ